MTEKKIARIIRSILRFIAQCHAKGVIYRDVKPDNFLFLSKDDNSPLRATDFGLSIRSGWCSFGPVAMRPRCTRRAYHAGFLPPARHRLLPVHQVGLVQLVPARWHSMLAVPDWQASSGPRSRSEAVCWPTCHLTREPGAVPDAPDSVCLSVHVEPDQHVS